MIFYYDFPMLYIPLNANEPGLKQYNEFKGFGFDSKSINVQNCLQS